MAVAEPTHEQLEQAARWVLARARDVAGSLEVGDLVAEGWLEWERRRNWARVVRVMRDRVRAERRAASTSHDPEDLAAEPAPPTLPPGLAPRHATVLRMLAEGREPAATKGALRESRTPGAPVLRLSRELVVGLKVSPGAPIRLVRAAEQGRTRWQTK